MTLETKILIIEDEEKFARLIELELGYEGYNVTKAFDGKTGLELAQTGRFDLVLLDIMLPRINGMEVLRRIRINMQVPIIMLTARDSVMDKVSGLDSGANDYITKPFAIEELLARIRVLLRKNSVLQGNTLLSAGGVLLDTVRHTVSVNGTAVELTKREFDLLHYLLKNKGIVISRDILLENVWGYDFAGDTNAVDVYIRYLRCKIDDTFNIRLIHTVRGVGYVIKDGE
jgi:two-component system response regulator ArlR